MRALVLLSALGACLAPAVAVGQERYLAFGDSITLGVGDDPERADQGYPPRLEELLRAAGIEAEVENHGVGGERTPQALERVNAVLDRGGSGFLLMEGSNDVSRQISLETTLFNLDEMARRALVRGISPVHATVIPRVPWATIDADNKTNARLNQEIRNLAEAAGRRLVDNFEIFGASADPYGRLYLNDSNDHVGHPNGAGYDLMARAFADVLLDVDSVPPVVAGLFPADGSRGVPADSQIQIDLVDFGAGIDTAATSLLVNGAPVQAVLTGGPRRAVLGFSPPASQPWSGVVTLGLRTRDLATPPHAVDRRVASFAVAGVVLPVGDLDESGRVDGADLVVLARAFGSRNGELRYWRPADLDGDGRVDGNDLAVVAANFGRPF